MERGGTAADPMPDSSRDRATVARQLGREPRAFRVAARCPFGEPSVVENEKSRDMPTRFWITCNSLDAAIARVEATGGVRQAQEDVGESAIEEIHEAHRSRHGGRVAGVREGGYVKCLHAFTALQLAGDIENPIAGWTLERLDRPFPENACCSHKDE
ncbi:MAG: DUF501 domain-containing protein [Rubrobacteraceae bacterium]